ncbi:MAG: AraC family transcriptional regulator [Sphingobacteriales bacterium]|nr:MAG: AraC family transcriptional regulator [Sphingobacteriales bacterium]
MRYLLHENNEPVSLPGQIDSSGVSGRKTANYQFPQGSWSIAETHMTDFVISVHQLVLTADLTVPATADEPLVILHYMLEGETQGTSESYSAHHLHEGHAHLFYIPPGETFMIQMASGKYRAVHIKLSTGLLADLSRHFKMLAEITEAIQARSVKGLQLPPCLIDFHNRSILEEVLNADTEKPGLELLLHARCYELLRLYLETTGKQEEANPAYLKKLQLVKNYILTHLDQELGTMMLSRKFGWSCTTLKRQFRLHEGLTIRDFILQHRMLEGMRLIVHTNMSISEIGIRLGYMEFSSFTRAFTRYHGQPPSQYRKASGP